MFSLGSKSSESQPHLLITPRIVTVNYSCFHMVNVSYMYMYNTAQCSSKRSFFPFPHVIKCCSNTTIFFTSSCSLTVSTGMSEFSCLVNRIHTQRTKFHTDFPFRVFVSLHSTQNIPPTLSSHNNSQFLPGSHSTL